MNSQIMGAIADLPQSQSLKDYNSGWAYFRKFSDLTHPTPVNTFVFCDESMTTLNDGYLQMGLNTIDFPDVPANYDCGGNCFSFADGHGEYKVWKYVANAPRTGLKTVPNGRSFGYPYGNHWLGGGSDTDFLWLARHASWKAGVFWLDN